MSFNSPGLGIHVAISTPDGSCLQPAAKRPRRHTHASVDVRAKPRKYICRRTVPRVETNSQSFAIVRSRGRRSIGCKVVHVFNIPEYDIGRSEYTHARVCKSSRGLPVYTRCSAMLCRCF